METSAFLDAEVFSFMEISMIDYSNHTTIRGHPAYKITWLCRAKNGMVELYAPPLQQPALRLFPTQLGMLTAVDIDPQEVGDEPYYANFYALYKESNRKLNAHGHPYKDVVELVPISAATPDRQTEVLENILEEVRDIRDYLFNKVRPARSQNQPMTPPPSQATEEQAPDDDEKPEMSEEEIRMQLISMLGPHLYLQCKEAAGMESEAGSDDGWELFRGAMQRKIVPERVTAGQLIDTCQLIDEEWHPGRPWWPMALALTFYVKNTAVPDPDKDNALLCATGLYLAIPAQGEAT